MIVIKPMLFIIVIYFLLKSFLNKVKIATPTIPPIVFPMTSVISLAPIANTNCKISSKKLRQKHGKSIFINDHFGFNMPIYTPNGTNTNILYNISLICKCPFTISEP